MIILDNNLHCLINIPLIADMLIKDSVAAVYCEGQLTKDVNSDGSERNSQYSSLCSKNGKKPI